MSDTNETGRFKAPKPDSKSAENKSMCAVDDENGSSTCEQIDVKFGACIQEGTCPPSDIVLYGNSNCFDGDKTNTDTPIEAHKNILASVSPHLRDAFTSADFTDSGANTYKIDQIDHETLRLIVACTYQAEVHVSGENAFKRVERVLVGADYLLIPELVSACGRSLECKSTYLNLATCISKWTFATKYHCKVLAAAAARIAASDLIAVSKQDGFLHLTHENMVQFVEDVVEDLNLKPDTLCDAVIAWLTADETARKKWCNDAMRHVPFQKITAKGLLRASECKFLSADVLLKIQQIQAVRKELDRVKSSFKVILEDYEGLRDLWTDLHKAQDSDDDYHDNYDYTDVDSKDKRKSLARCPGGRAVIAQRLVGYVGWKQQKREKERRLVEDAEEDEDTDEDEDKDESENTEEDEDKDTDDADEYESDE